MNPVQAYQYENTHYIVLSDGRVARLLKPTKIHNQTYINLIIDKKMKRVNVKDLEAKFSSVNGSQQTA